MMMGYGSSTTQFLEEESMGSIMKVDHLHSHHACSSVETLSPRSVLEQQRTLSGLAIAIDLEEKMRLSSPKQENVVLGRFSCKQSTLQMSTQEAQGKEDQRVGRYVSRERIFFPRERLSHMKHGEREACTGESFEGLKMVSSMQQMSKQELGKAEDEKLLMGRSLSRERMRGRMHKNDERKEREAFSGGSNRGLMVGASLGGVREEDNACASGNRAVVKSGADHPASPSSSCCGRGSCKCGQRTRWLHELGHDVQQNFPAVEDSIFYYAAATNPFLPSSTHHHRHRHSPEYGAPVDEFLQCCYSCKCSLSAGKDIYMYRGDQAFCSVECRYKQIAKDECMGG